MSRFIFIDHSLKRIGGHHVDYAFHVLTAAEQAGHEIALATHRRFRQSTEQLPASWDVYPLFRYDTYRPETVFRAARSERSLGWWRQRQRAKVIASFARSCRRLFRRIPLHAGDHVFLATLSELDLLGLARFLKFHDPSREADWHLQFHYNIFEGREPEYAQQSERLQAVRNQFQQALAQIPRHRLHFYNTSEPLTDQYNLLGLAEFRSLAYPVNPQFSPWFKKGSDTVVQSTQRAVPATVPDPFLNHDRPLRITCAGAIRGEKGHSRLNRLVQSIWPGCLADGNAQLVVQSKKAHRRDVPRLQLAIPGQRKTRAEFHRPDEAATSDPIIYVRQPLSTPEYVEFIRAADIGLMLYDSQRYYARRAGVLGEFLAAGIPVVVPAGCWLAEQIAEPIFQHLDRASQALPVVRQDSLNKLAFGDASAPAVENLLVPSPAAELLVSFHFDMPQSAGRYVRLEVFQMDATGCVVHRAVQTVGRRTAGGPSRTMFHLHPSAAQVRLNWRNAYHHESLAVCDVQVSFHDRARVAGDESAKPQHVGDVRQHPSGAVGLIAAEQAEVASLLREMIANYDHYRTTAARFAREWFQRHDPRETLAQLVGKQSDRFELQQGNEAA